MKLIDELDGSLLKLWGFWSVRLGVLAAACTAALTTYAGFKVIDPAIVAWVPMWVLGALAGGGMLFSASAVVARGIPQPKLREPQGGDDTEHA
jgi:hypothetical protein